MDFTLNGRALGLQARPGATILDVLREECGITSVKDGCAPEGMCGACTVLVDGRAVVSCAQPAERLAGKHVITQEGLTTEERALWADCFTATGASQCGFCSPGIVMKAEALLAKDPEPTRERILKSLAGNLCRCTGYTKIVDAIALAAAARRGGSLPVIDRSGAVGSRSARYGGTQLALGDHLYVNDMSVPGMLHGAIRFSDHPRARVLAIDVSAARRHPGVAAVLTARDVRGQREQGALIDDWPQLVAEGEETRYVGDVIAVVAADTRAAAREAAALVGVEYDVLEPVTDPVLALEASAPKVHAGGNLLDTSAYKRGDVDGALAAAAYIETETFQTQFIEHAFLEPESSLAIPTDDGGIHFYSQGQGIWDDRRQVASFLGLPLEKVRATQVSCGGAFGAKEDLNVQGHASLLARSTRLPVQLTLSRAESIRFHVKRHPLTMTYTVGCDSKGKLVALRARIVGDTGAYASVGAKVLERAAGHACGPYEIPNVDVDARAVYTNNPPAGAMRGFGVNQVTFAMDGMLDRLAAKVGIDGWDIRWLNAVEVGGTFGTGQILGPGVGIRKTLLAVRDAYKSAKYAGIGCGVKNTGIGNGLKEYGRAVLRPEADGTVTLFHSWTEMGQGVHTVLSQIACQELGLDLSRLRVAVDTEKDLDTGQTTASRSTVLGGRAVIVAARKLKAAMDHAPLARLAGQEFAGEVSIDWTTKPGAPVAVPVTHFAYSWATQVVILDGEGRIERVVAAHDVGKAINPMLVEGQVEGGVHMGLGYALSEEFVVKDGVPVTANLKSQHIIPSTGMPPVDVILVEEPEPEGPYGAKGAGEIGLVPTAAAVAGALFAFDGVRRNRLPMKDSPAARAAVPKLAFAAVHGHDHEHAEEES
jgi:selenium-dependent xanthine dehydrogenase